MYADITLPAGRAPTRVSAKATATLYCDDVDSELECWRWAARKGQRYRFIVTLQDGRDPDVEYILRQEAWPGVEPAEWATFQESVRASPPYEPVAADRERKARNPASHVGGAVQTRPQDEKLFQKILRLAFDAVSPNKAPVLAEAVRAKFVEAYPPGKNNSAKQAASAVRKAWSRALQYPPVGIAVDGGYISAMPA